jgi:ornithine carbamoyltransferase
LTKHLLSLQDLTKNDILEIFNKATGFKYKYKRQEQQKPLKKRMLALFFGAPSLRTRISFEVAMNQLGGNSIYIKADPSNVYMTEDTPDQAMVLSSYVDAVVMRLKEHEKIEEFARYSTVPVINGMSNDFHPCQILTDLFTILDEKKRLEGLKLTFFGDGDGNTAHCMLFGCAKLGIDLCLSCPPEFSPKTKYLNQAEQLALESGAEIMIEHDPRKAARDTDIIYTDSWEAEPNEMKFFWPYRVTEDLVNLAKDDVIILHCLPAIRNLEIESGVINGPRSRIHEEAQNKLHIAKAILTFFIK